MDNLVCQILVTPVVYKRMNAQNTDFTHTLRQAGLSEDEAIVYERVLKKGRAKASTVIRTTDLKRGHVYNLLSKLVSKDLLEKFEVNGVAHYRPTHPSQLKKDIQQQKNELQRRENALKRGMDEIISTYNKAHQKPTVQYYEGSEGIKEALYNSLETDGEIYTYTDPRTVKKYMEEENNEYVSKRKEKEVHKKLLLFDSKLAHEAKQEGGDEYTDIRIIDKENVPEIEAAAEIYDDTVTYLTISDQQKIAAEITDERIAQMQKQLFLALWKASE